MQVVAPAKINLTLRVVGRLAENGFHLLHSLVLPLTLYDQINLGLLGCREKNNLEPFSGVSFACKVGEQLHKHLFAASAKYNELNQALKTINSSENIVVRAAEEFLREVRLYGQVNLNIELEKNIPFQAGLGGGSSDAAQLILLLSRMLKLEYSLKKLYKVGARIGSDVPVMMGEGLSFVDGTGDRVMKLDPATWPDYLRGLENLWVILVKPLVGVDTSRAYELMREKRKDIPVFSLAEFESRAKQMAEEELARLGFALKGNIELSGRRGAGAVICGGKFQSQFESFLAHIGNDFEDIVREEYPEIREAFSLIVEEGGHRPLLAGSGSTIAVFEGKEERAKRLSLRIQELRPAWFVAVVRPRLANEGEK